MTQKLNDGLGDQVLKYLSNENSYHTKIDYLNINKAARLPQNEFTQNKNDPPPSCLGTTKIKGFKIKIQNCFFFKLLQQLQLFVNVMLLCDISSQCFKHAIDQLETRGDAIP